MESKISLSLIFPSVLPTKILGAFVNFAMLAAFPNYLIILVFVLIIVNGEGYKFWFSLF